MIKITKFLCNLFHNFKSFSYFFYNNYCRKWKGVENWNQRKQNGSCNLTQLPDIIVVIPEVLPICPRCYILIKTYCKYYEFYPSKRHKKPTAILKSTGWYPYNRLYVWNNKCYKVGCTESYFNTPVRPSVSPNNKKAHFKMNYFSNDFKLMSRMEIEPIICWLKVRCSVFLHRNKWGPIALLYFHSDGSLFADLFTSCRILVCRKIHV